MATWVRAQPRDRSISAGPSGGMADTTDSKSVARKGVRVQIPPRAPTDQRLCGDSALRVVGRGKFVGSIPHESPWIFALYAAWVAACWRLYRQRRKLARA